MKLIYLPFFIILYIIPSISFTDPIDNVADLIRHGNIHELAKLFAPTVEITLLTEENSYTKAQAELVLDKFFTENKPKSVVLLHKVNSNANYSLGVLILTADKSIFRISYTLKEVSGTFTIIELRVEAETVK